MSHFLLFTYFPLYYASQDLKLLKILFLQKHIKTVSCLQNKLSYLGSYSHSKGSAEKVNQALAEVPYHGHTPEWQQGERNCIPYGASCPTSTDVTHIQRKHILKYV